MIHFEKKTKNLELTPELESYLDKKIRSFSNILKVFKEPLDGWVEIEKIDSKEMYRAEFQLIWQKYSIRGEAKGETPFSAIDEARDKFERELEKLKTKVENIDKENLRKLKESYD